MANTTCTSFAQPVFIATLLSGIILYLFSVFWLYRKYAYHMTPRQKEIVWGGLISYTNNSSPYRLRFWVLTASLSGMGFLGSWVAMLSEICREGANENIRTEQQYVFTIIILLQSLFNVSVVSMLHFRGLYFKIASMGILLWASVLAYVWLWHITWNIFPKHNTQDLQTKAILWALHALNTCLIFHGVWWDGIFWWFTWGVEMAKEEKYTRLMHVADHATGDFIPHHDSVGLKNDDDDNNNNTSCRKEHKVKDASATNRNATPLLFSEIYQPPKYYFDSLSYYPYFPYLFEPLNINQNNI